MTGAHTAAATDGPPSPRWVCEGDAWRCCPPALGGRVWIWLVDPEDPGVYGADTDLSERERARAARFFRDVDRRQFVAAHALLRAKLALALSLPPDEVRFTRAALGRPELAADQQPQPTGPLGPGRWSFSLSHTRGLVGVALAWGCRVGFDVEAQRPVDALALAPGILDDTERAEVAALPDPARWRRFLRLWTLKEAALKVHGAGLTIPANTLQIRGADQPTPRIVGAPGALAGAANRVVSWQITAASLPRRT